MFGTGVIYKDRKLVPWDEATIHVCSHVVHYGSAVFEGIRAYDVGGKAGIFRLRDHMQRLVDSAKIYRMPLPMTLDEMIEACIETVRANGYQECYLRPILYRGYGKLGVDPSPCPVDFVCATWQWGKYLGADAIEQGVDVCTSSWARIAPNTLPSMAKAAANYMNAQLIKMEALVNGYKEGIGLDVDGYVSEASGANIFMIRRGKISTPPVASSILTGITRDTVAVLARELGMTVEERRISREELYIADEVFFTGTAAEVSPIRSIDKISIGSGTRGPITERLQHAYFATVGGRHETHRPWITVV